MDNISNPKKGDRITFKIHQKMEDGKYRKVSYNGIIESISADNYHNLYTVKRLSDGKYYQISEAGIFHIWSLVA